MKAIETIVLLVVLLPIALWTLAWTYGIFMGSVEVTKSAAKEMSDRGVPKPAAFLLAVIIGILCFLFLGWIISNGGS
jgi:hypothetical protein